MGYGAQVEPCLLLVAAKRREREHTSSLPQPARRQVPSGECDEGARRLQTRPPVNAHNPAIGLPPVSLT